MKFLTQVPSLEELNRLKILFEMNGVLLHTGNEGTARNFSLFHPAGKYTLYVVLKEQYKDAELLLADKGHVVKNQVNIEAYRQLSEKSSSSILNQILRKTLFVFLITSLIAIGLTWYLFT